MYHTKQNIPPNRIQKDPPPRLDDVTIIPRVIVILDVCILSYRGNLGRHPPIDPASRRVPCVLHFRAFSLIFSRPFRSRQRALVGGALTISGF